MTETVVLGGGCFWCIEAAFKELEGVETVTSGYAGGHIEDPSYEEVCTGETGHAEVVKVEFDEEDLDLEEILELFFRIHDPTTRDRQGPDVGSQYRSIVLYQSKAQKEAVEAFIEGKRQEYEEEVVTEVERLERFYRAEKRHQAFFEKNPGDAYCRINAAPKVEKAREFRNG